MSATEGASARTPCQRCGTYAVLVDYDGHRICEDCIARLSELERTPPTVGNLLAGSLWVLTRIGPVAALVLAVAELPIVLLELAVPDLPTLVSTGWGATVSVLAQGLVLHLAQRAIRGEPMDFGRAFRRVSEAGGNLIFSNLLAGLHVFVFTLLLIVPGIVRGLSLALVLPIALHEDARSSDVLRASTDRMKGHRLTALAAYFVWGSGWLLVLAGYLAFNFFLELPEGAAIPEAMYWAVAVGGGVLLQVLMLPVVCTTAVLYAKTLRYRIY